MRLLLLLVPLVAMVRGLTDPEKARFNSAPGESMCSNRVSLASDGFQMVLESNGVPDHPAEQCNDNVASMHNHRARIADLQPGNDATQGQYCVGQLLGFMVNGVPLYNAFNFDAQSGTEMYEDEVMGFDSCDGHTSRAEGDFGVYHYHNASRCLIPFSNAENVIIGVALDGYGIYYGVPAGVTLDECHGAMVGGRYRYYANMEFPYTIGCFRRRPLGGQNAECNMVGSGQLCVCDGGSYGGGYGGGYGGRSRGDRGDRRRGRGDQPGQPEGQDPDVDVVFIGGGAGAGGAQQGQGQGQGGYNPNPRFQFQQPQGQGQDPRFQGQGQGQGRRFQFQGQGEGQRRGDGDRRGRGRGRGRGKRQAEFEPEEDMYMMEMRGRGDRRRDGGAGGPPEVVQHRSLPSPPTDACVPFPAPLVPGQCPGFGPAPQRGQGGYGGEYGGRSRGGRRDSSTEDDDDDDDNNNNPDTSGNNNPSSNPGTNPGNMPNNNGGNVPAIPSQCAMLAMMIQGYDRYIEVIIQQRARAQTMEEARDLDAQINLFLGEVNRLREDQRRANCIAQPQFAFP